MEFWRVIYEETNFPNPFFDAIPGRILDRQFVDIVKLGIDQDSKRPQIVILIIGRLGITVYEIHQNVSFYYIVSHQVFDGT